MKMNLDEPHLHMSKLFGGDRDGMMSRFNPSEHVKTVHIDAEGITESRKPTSH
jgi:hypothetical protein